MGNFPRVVRQAVLECQSPGDYGAGLAPGERKLAAYAASALPSRGREHDEAECPTRGPFQRDRDRVLHSTPFRRLTYKTQVFVYHEGDHYRTRLTHSLEVAQIARTITRQLRLDEDLAEVLALAHDLGHSPFGHAGERALDRVLCDYGGFDHNAQTLRIVMRLERKYRAFDGLNLSWETLEGLAKHNGPVAGGLQSPVGKAVESLEAWCSLDLQSYASAEAQVAALSDDIAYINHDIDDALRAGLISADDLCGIPVAGGVMADVGREQSAPWTSRILYELNRRMITVMIADCVRESRRRLAVLAPSSADDIRRAEKAIVAFSPELASQLLALKDFLYKRVYRHQRVMRVMHGAESIVSDLFERYFAEPHEMHEGWRADAPSDDARARARLVSDFVSGMTDRLAISEHRRLFDATPDLR